MPGLSGLIPELATLAQSAEQTLRKRQVKGSNPLGGLIDIGRPQQLPVGAFAVSSVAVNGQGRQCDFESGTGCRRTPMVFATA